MRRYAAATLLTVLSVALLLRVIDWSATSRAVQSATPGYVALATGFLLLSIAAKVARWKLLLPPDAGISRWRLYRILHISYLFNNVLPARIGDVARITLTSRTNGTRMGHALSSLMTERVVDAVTLTGAFLAVSPFLTLSATSRFWLRVAWTLIAVAIVVILLLTVVRWSPRPFGGKWLTARLPGSNRMREEARSFGEGWSLLVSREHMWGIWAWSALAWGSAFAINYSLMLALDIDAPITVAILLTCTTNFAMLLPSSPAYIGVFHAAATFSLLPFGVKSSTALSFAILAHLVNVIPVSILGAVFLLAGHELRSIRSATREGEAARAGVASTRSP
ncbi:MAG: lysylphosphatidylglycerol synthase transmembrane domain-containing protein [Dehalococcoidia bacterium]